MKSTRPTPWVSFAPVAHWPVPVAKHVRPSRVKIDSIWQISLYQSPIDWTIVAVRANRFVVANQRRLLSLFHLVLICIFANLIFLLNEILFFRGFTGSRVHRALTAGSRRETIFMFFAFPLLVSNETMKLAVLNKK